jgi:hypothetical protein
MAKATTINRDVEADEMGGTLILGRRACQPYIGAGDEPAEGGQGHGTAQRSSD